MYKALTITIFGLVVTFGFMATDVFAGSYACNEYECIQCSDNRAFCMNDGTCFCVDPD